MRFEFDPAKDALNHAKHGVSLAHGQRVFDDVAVMMLAASRPIDGEDRAKAVGMIEGRLWTAVHVYRGDAIRLISVRRSNDGERRGYHRDRG